MTDKKCVLLRKFQWTELNANKNRWWQVETFDDGSVKTTHGRVGYEDKNPTWLTGGLHTANSLAAAKLRKGYKEVDLVVPTVVVAPVASANGGDPKLAQVVDLIFREAGEYIKNYLSVSVDALSATQILNGRSILKQIIALNKTLRSGDGVPFAVIRKVEEFYNAIPTKLPHKIKPEEVAHDFLAHMSEQEERLDQLEAAVATYATQSTSAVSNVDVLGAKLQFVPQTDNRYEQIVRHIDRTMVHGYRVQVRDVLEVEIPKERCAFDTEMIGKGNVQQMFHGTAGQNVRHILRSGLRLPTTVGNGKMFGYGIYFASVASKSTNYCSAHGSRNFLFLADVGLGNMHRAPRATENLKSAPSGYDSVHGVAGFTKTWGTSTLLNDEFIVYRPSQQTIRYLVTFERR